MAPQVTIPERSLAEVLRRRPALPVEIRRVCLCKACVARGANTHA